MTGRYEEAERLRHVALSGAGTVNGATVMLSDEERARTLANAQIHATLAVADRLDILIGLLTSKPNGGGF